MKKPCLLSLIILATFKLCLSQMSLAPAIPILDYSNDISATNSVQFSDINSDGNEDMVLIKKNAIVIRKGLGNAEFGEDSIVYNSDSVEFWSASNLYDINKDGKLDLALMGSKKITFLKGTNTGFDFLFSKNGITEDISGNPLLCDFDNEGSTDIIFGTAYGLSIIYNCTDPLSQLQSFVESSWAHSFDVLDFNLDGHEDLVFHTYGKLEFYTQDNNAKITKAYTFITPDYLEYDCGDLDLDGYPDIVIWEQNASSIDKLTFNSTDNTFTKTQIQDGFFNVGCPTLFDIDNNNSLDILFGARMGGLCLIKNMGNSLLPAEYLVENGLMRNNDRFLFEDLNNDNQSDIILTSISNVEVILLNSTQQVIDLPNYIIQPANNDILFEDIDGDTYKDLILVRDKGLLTIYWGSSNGIINEKTDIIIPKFAKKATILDINGDFKKDLLIGIKSPTNSINEIISLISKGNRSYENYSKWRYNGGNAKPFVADLFNDNSLEVIVADSYGNPQINWYHSEVTDYDEYFNVGNSVNLINGTYINNISLGDINFDGYTDIAASNGYSTNISILINNKIDNFTESILDIGRNVEFAELIDLNNNDTLDLFVVTNVNYVYKAEFYKGDGKGGFFFEYDNLIEHYQPRTLRKYDIDNNGIFELVLSDLDFTNTTIFEFENSKWIKSKIKFQNVGQGYRVYDDFNNDKKIDALTTSMNDGSLILQLNNTVYEPNFSQVSSTVLSIAMDSTELGIEYDTDVEALILVRESKVDSLKALPIDNKLYTVNNQFGIGSSIGDAYVVASGSDSIYAIKGLKPNTKYDFFVFAYSKNYPNNTIINYSSDYVMFSIATDSSIFLLKNFEKFEVNEDSSISISLNEYIHNFGENLYTITTTDVNVIVEQSNDSAIIYGIENYFGECAVKVSVKTPTESREFNFEVSILPINDQPIIGIITDTLSTNLNEIQLLLDVSDIDNSFNDLIITANSSDNEVVNTNDIVVEMNDNTAICKLLPKKNGVATITLTVTDGEFFSSTSFNVTINEIVAVDDSVLVTFNLDVSAQAVNTGDNYLNESDVFYVTGSFNNWIEPGKDSSILMTKGANNIWTASIEIAKNTTFEYKYYLNAGLNGADGTPENRTLAVLEEDVTTNDVWRAITNVDIESELFRLVSVYPNPIKEKLIITNLEGVYKVFISNIFGVAIITKEVTNSTIEIDANEFNSGIYVITFVSINGHTRSEKIIKE